MRLSFGFLSLVTVALTGCGPACNSSNICSVSGSPGDQAVGDGSDFRGCNDGDRGLTINCMTRNQRAVCSPNGWAFEPTGPSSDGGTQD